MHSQPTIEYALLSPRIGKYHVPTLQNSNQTLTLCLKTRPEGTSKGTCESVTPAATPAISTKSQQQKRLRVFAFVDTHTSILKLMQDHFRMQCQPNASTLAEGEDAEDKVSLCLPPQMCRPESSVNLSGWSALVWGLRQL